MYLCMCVSVNIKRPFFFYDRPYSSSSISNFSNSAVCNSASITSTELCELVYKGVVPLRVTVDGQIYSKRQYLGFDLYTKKQCT